MSKSLDALKDEVRQNRDAVAKTGPAVSTNDQSGADNSAAGQPATNPPAGGS